MIDDSNTFLEVALEAAQAAEKILLKYINTTITVELKSDQSPVTVADKEAEAVIISTIQNAFPDHGFLGEETGLTRERAEYVWVIDPIDGTKNYIRGVPIFGSLIALMKNGEVILGVSNVPLMKELFYAEKGKGAYKNGIPVTVSTRPTLKESYVSHGGINYFIKKTNYHNCFLLWVRLGGVGILAIVGNIIC